MIFDFAMLEKKARGELYRSLYNQIIDAIECGAVKVGDKLPSIREAAAQLNVSRTTVENAYTRLCIEGIAESKPQSGYFIIEGKKTQKNEIKTSTVKKEEIKYDFSSRSIDIAVADTERWKKTLRSVLFDSSLLVSYGERQGEYKLREALAEYSYRARGVKAKAENIVIGAGVGPLLNILCGILNKNITVGLENGGFAEAESIFFDYGMKTVLLESDNSGAKSEAIIKNNIDLMVLLPSQLSKISISALNNRRNQYIKWLNSGDERYIIEDDYNGELRYTARTVNSFQSKAPQSTIYIGSFSKLLLPSVRIAYMVLPDSLMNKFMERQIGYNQTCGKIEQLALADYIIKGHLEKHLRRLRRIYYNKSQILISEIKKSNPDCKFKLYESSLIIELQTGLNSESDKICKILYDNGVNAIAGKEKGSIRLCFAGISEEKLPEAAEYIKGIIYRLKTAKNIAQI